MSDAFRRSPSTRSTPIPGVPGPYVTPISPSQTLPLMDGVAAIGTLVSNYALADHVHPSDTSKASLSGANFIGQLTAPTPSPGDNSNRVATTAFVTGGLAAYAPLASPTFSGIVTIPAGALISGYAPLASPTFSGTVTIPPGAAISGYAPLASPVFTGKPQIPGVTDGSNALAGDVGEYLSVIVTNVPLINNVLALIATLNLTAGDWDVWANANIFTATIDGITIGISTSPTTLGGAAADNTSIFSFGSTTASSNIAMGIAPCRWSISAPASAYLTGEAEYTSGSLIVNARICARRVR